MKWEPDYSKIENNKIPTVNTDKVNKINPFIAGPSGVNF
jgi:hypothetical protein